MAGAVSFRRFSLLLLGWLALLLGAVAMFNRVVDPFWYYRDVEIEGFNLSKPHFANVERHIKPVIFARTRPQAMVLGSSYSDVGLDPLQTDFTRGGKLHGYNLALAGTYWPEEFCSFRFALERTDLRRAVLELRLQDFPVVDCNTILRDFEGPGPGELLLSFRTLRAAVSTVYRQRSEKPSYSPEGLYYLPGVGVDRAFTIHLINRYSAKGCDLSPVNAPPGTPVPPPKTGPRRELELSGLRQLVRTAAERNVELRLVVYPPHMYWVEADALCGAPIDRWDALQQIATAVEQASHGSDSIQIWDFVSYDERTAEPVSDNMTFWVDSLHFSPRLGNRMLEQMFSPAGDSDQSFGVRVRPGELPALRRRFEQQRQAFIATHPGFYPGLRPLIERK
jgi:hypothetical protein